MLQELEDMVGSGWSLLPNRQHATWLSAGKQRLRFLHCLHPSSLPSKPLEEAVLLIPWDVPTDASMGAWMWRGLSCCVHWDEDGDDVPYFRLGSCMLGEAWLEEQGYIPSSWAIPSCGCLKALQSTLVPPLGKSCLC